VGQDLAAVGSPVSAQVVGVIGDRGPEDSYASI
jgi:hypothetical protein